MSEDELPQSDCRDAARHPRFSYNLYGQQTAEAQFLQSLNSGRMHHAWLLSGPAGIGKATLAWRIARTILSHGAGKQIDTLETSSSDPIARRLEALAEPRFTLIRHH